MINRNAKSDLIEMSSDELSVLVRVFENKLPEVVYWGQALGDSTKLIESIAPSTLNPPLPIAVLDQPINYSILPTKSYLYRGHQALRGSREGIDFAVKLELKEIKIDSDKNVLTIILVDTYSELTLKSIFSLVNTRILSIKHSITNTSESRYQLDELSTTMPIPARATELLDFFGCWCKERIPQRQKIFYGKHIRESRRGRTGHDAATMILTGTPSFNNQTGEIWAVHLAWSGDQFYFAEKSPSGHQNVGCGELLESGEIVLAKNETYETPESFYVYSRNGLDGISDQFHRYLRSQRSITDRPKHVIFNSWESVYFDLNENRLRELALAAKKIGAELFVIDDGWFKGRRDANKGLGDWEVDRSIFPDGLNPLIDFINANGMRFGIWVEPEMVNIDSDTFRENPEWLLKPNSHRLPPGGRGGQQALDLMNPEAFQSVFNKLDSLLSKHNISYLKWDMNRDLIDAGHEGKPAVHGQTKAMYQLFSMLKNAHPSVDFENCSSGGGRIDLGIGKLTDRTWVSDTNDPLERSSIQRWTALLLPPEMMGNDVSTAESHTTGRTHTFAFRAAVALFGHLGIQQDLMKNSEKELKDLQEFIEFYKSKRNLICEGRYVNADLDLDGEYMHGVVAQDKHQGLFVYWKERNSGNEFSPRVRFPYLDGKKTYLVSIVKGALFPKSSEIQIIGELKYPDWIKNAPITIPGEILMQIGLYMPILSPESALVIEVKAID